MPEISRFYGIVIKMYHNDHLPPHLWAAQHQGELQNAWNQARQMQPIDRVDPLP